MSSKQDLFEKFGKQLMEEVRDRQIHFAEMFLDRKAPLSDKYKDELDGMSPEQIELMKKLVVLLVDGTLHDFFYLLEDSTWIRLRLESEDVEIEDIRQVTSGALQGYVSIWAEKYSKKRLLDI